MRVNAAPAAAFLPDPPNAGNRKNISTKIGFPEPPTCPTCGAAIRARRSTASQRTSSTAVGRGQSGGRRGWRRISGSGAGAEAGAESHPDDEDAREGEPDSPSKEDGEEGNDAGEEKGDEEERGESTNEREEEPDGSVRRNHAATSPQKRTQRAGKRAHRAARAVSPRTCAGKRRGEKRVARRGEVELEVEAELRLREAAKNEPQIEKRRKENRSGCSGRKRGRLRRGKGDVCACVRGVEVVFPCCVLLYVRSGTLGDAEGVDAFAVDGALGLRRMSKTRARVRDIERPTDGAIWTSIRSSNIQTNPKFPLEEYAQHLPHCDKCGD
ncbi:hypothetical protein C8R44DRAFT_753772 [Mycena epipterygia]|nr:hypothetical protein C8R44DRAFT_753772 [Mycena epipterygia]